MNIHLPNMRPAIKLLYIVDTKVVIALNLEEDMLIVPNNIHEKITRF